MTKLCEAGEGGKGQDIDDLRANDRTVKHGEQAELSRLVCQHVDSSFADTVISGRFKGLTLSRLKTIFSGGCRCFTQSA